MRTIFKVFVEFVTILLLFFMFWFFGLEACGILAPWPRIQPTTPVLEVELLISRLPGKSLDHFGSLWNLSLCTWLTSVSSPWKDLFSLICSDKIHSYFNTTSTPLRNIPWNNILPLLPKRSENVGRSVVSGSLWLHGLCPTGLLCPWNSPGKNTGTVSPSLLGRVGLNSGGLHCRQILYYLSHQRSPLKHTNWG